ncbi:MAG: hypothetical protein ACR2J8_11060, partial [Thermomicrobiales bacterium]
MDDGAKSKPFSDPPIVIGVQHRCDGGRHTGQRDIQVYRSCGVANGKQPCDPAVVRAHVARSPTASEEMNRECLWKHPEFDRFLHQQPVGEWRRREHAGWQPPPFPFDCLRVPERRTNPQ